MRPSLALSGRIVADGVGLILQSLNTQRACLFALICPFPSIPVPHLPVPRPLPPPYMFLRARFGFVCRVCGGWDGMGTAPRKIAVSAVGVAGRGGEVWGLQILATPRSVPCQRLSSRRRRMDPSGTDGRKETLIKTGRTKRHKLVGAHKIMKRLNSSTIGFQFTKTSAYYTN